MALTGLGIAHVDHYEWAAIGSPQKVGVPVEVEISARDKLGGLLDDFAGVVNLRVDAEPGNLGLVTPQATGAFLAGLWRGNALACRRGPRFGILCGSPRQSRQAR